MKKDFAILNRIFIFWLLLISLIGIGGFSCVGGGSGGGLSGVGPSNMEGTGGPGDINPTGNTQAANPGSIQAGNEGHGQEQRIPFKLTSATPDGQTNCGKPFVPPIEIFPASENAPQLYAGFSESESGPFTPSLPRESFGTDGRRDLPSCSIMTSLSPEEGSQYTNYKFIKATLVFSDKDEKFYQSETKVVACIPPELCRQTLCEECFTLKDESTIPEEERVRISLPAAPVTVTPVGLPSVPSNPGFTVPFERPQGFRNFFPAP